MKVTTLIFIIILFGLMATTKQVNVEARDLDLLYRAKCTACHRVYPPGRHTYQKLQTYVARYGKGLSDEERRRIVEYLKENAKREPAGWAETGNE